MSAAFAYSLRHGCAARRLRRLMAVPVSRVWYPFWDLAPKRTNSPMQSMAIARATRSALWCMAIPPLGPLPQCAPL
jgi:hypothetical protein